jgi:hypothetical protein
MMNDFSPRMLRRYPNCPICGGRERSPAPFSPGDPGFYVDSFCDFLRVTPDKLFENLKLEECHRCGAVWYDPWFEPAVIGSAYLYVAGRHKLGWSTLAAWLEQRDRSYVHVQQNIIDLLRDVTGGLRGYAEVNCPFSGILVPLFDQRRPDDGRKLVLDRARILSAIYTEPTMITNYSNGSDLGLTVAPPSSETKTYLIDEPSPIIWGRSCALASVNCLALAKDTMVDNVTTFEELDEDGIVLDAIGFFNTFDHFIKPVRTLKKALRVAHHVQLDLHAFGWVSPQHLYNPGDRFTDFLEDIGISALDVTDRVRGVVKNEDERRYILCGIQK